MAASAPPASPPLVVYGASGHTGRFVTDELRRRGRDVILSGRDANKLRSLAQDRPETLVRAAGLDDAAALDRAFAGAAAVINCAGPFLDTAGPVIQAALRAGAHYLDVTAEQQAAINLFEQFDTPARTAGVVVVPAAAFYGGLADLLATLAVGDWPAAHTVRVGIALDSWKPTIGTRLTGQRNTYARLRVDDGELRPLPQPAPTGTWDFPPPFGEQPVVELPFTETILISRRLRPRALHSFLNLAPLTDLRDPRTPGPQASDELGRADQRFIVEVEARSGERVRRARAGGRDIYAVTAPIVVEAACRLLARRVQPGGAYSLGQLFDAREFLAALAAHLTVEVDPVRAAD